MVNDDDGWCGTSFQCQNASMCHFKKDYELSCLNSCHLETAGDILVDANVHLSSSSCQIFFRSKGGFTLNPGASIMAPVINIHSSTATLQASSKIIANWNDTSSPTKDNFDPEPIQFNVSSSLHHPGSVSLKTSKSITIFDHAQVTANGRAPGQSGGSILLQTQALSVQGTLSATGGAAGPIAAAAISPGSGGRVMIAYVTGSMVGRNQVLISGGKKPSSFSANQSLGGAAGSFYQVLYADDDLDNSVLAATLLISNRGSTDAPPSSSKTVLSLSESNFVSSLQIENHANVLITSTAYKSLAEFKMMSSFLKGAKNLNISARNILIDGQSSVTSTFVELGAQNEFVLGFNSSINFTKGNIVGRENVTIAGNINSKSFLSLSGGKVTCTGNIVSSSALSILSNNALTITGNVSSSSLDHNQCHLNWNNKSISKACNLSSPSYASILYSNQSVYIGQNVNSPTIIRAASVLVCAKDTVAIAQASAIDTTALGCSAGEGIGHGICSNHKSIIVGGGGGFGGTGGHLVSSDAGSVPYNMMSVGSGGGCPGGGSGGGLVQIHSPVLALQGAITANGQNGTSNSGGGGSGGYVGLEIDVELSGKGLISASGGDGASSSSGSTYGGGGGGGGRLVVSICKASSFDTCTASFNGKASVTGGSSRLPGATGSSEGPICPPGFSGLFCHACSKGFYKEDKGSLPCTPCVNAPRNAHYTSNASVSRVCEWVCDPGYAPGHLRTKCLAPFAKFVNSFGGDIPSFFVLLGTILLLVALGFSFRKKRNNSEKQQQQHLLKDNPNTTTIKGGEASYPKMKESDLKDHIYRLYFFGSNTPTSPWTLSSTVPKELENIVSLSEFKNFVTRVNNAVSWSSSSSSSHKYYTMLLLTATMFPLLSFVQRVRQIRRLNALKHVVSKHSHGFLRGTRARALLDSVKLGFSSDYSLAYLEILQKEDDLRLKPTLPLVLLLSGTGTYKNPYFLDPTDLLVQSVPQCEELSTFIDDAWIELVAELNNTLRVATLDDIPSLFPVLKFLHEKSLSCYLGDLTIQLGRFYSDELCKLGIYLSIAKEEKTTSTTSTRSGSSSIREDALRIRSRSISTDFRNNVVCQKIDSTLPVPGILYSLPQLQQRWEEEESVKKKLWLSIRRVLFPKNVLRSSASPSSVKVLALLIFLFIDFGMTTSIVVNLRCIVNGETNDDTCSTWMLLIVSAVYPGALFIAPVIGVISLAVGTPVLLKAFSQWNSLSLINATICVVVCYVESNSLVAPWFTRPVPVIPLATILVKFVEAAVVELYIADLETERRRRGWRGLIHSPLDSPTAASSWSYGSTTMNDNFINTMNPTRQFESIAEMRTTMIASSS